MRHNSQTAVPQGPSLSLVTQWDPEQFRAMIYSDPDAQTLRWYSATLDPTYDRKSGAANTAAGDQKWQRSCQNLYGVMALAGGSSVLRRYVDPGQILDSDIVVTVMPDEIALSDHDHVVLMGRRQDGSDAVTFEEKTVLVRGADLTALNGIVSSSGAVVTGTGTAFLSDLWPGNCLVAGGQSIVIASIADDTHLTLASSPTTALRGNRIQRGRDRLDYDPAAVLDCRDAAKVYQSGVDFTLSDDGQSVGWLTAGPAPGTRYAVVYSWYPRYIVLGDLGARQQAEQGVQMPRSFHCRLVGKDDYLR